MNCAESEIMLHALIDGELDAGHVRDVETHVEGCPACAAKLASFRTMRDAMADAGLRDSAPAHLRNRIAAALPLAPARVVAPRRSWRMFLGGFGIGAALSAAVAASLFIAIVGNTGDNKIASEIVSAHLRSLQPGHLTDVETSDQHTVKPWFNGKLDVAPPVIDLTAQGFTLIGGQLDTINGKSVGTVVYRRRKHVINLFVAQRLGTEQRSPKLETVQGFNILHWSENGLDFWAASDIDADELDEFGRKITAALRPSSAPS